MTRSTHGTFTHRAVIDLTPVLPGGDNGGIKVATLALVQSLSRIAPDWEWIVLTASFNHDELERLEAPNVRRVCALHMALPSRAPAPVPGKEPPPPPKNLKYYLRTLLPRPVKRALKQTYRMLRRRPDPQKLLKQLKADLLFCPFTSPNFYDPNVPIVSILCDLQYHYYPMFFLPADRKQRDCNVLRTLALVQKIVCISEYTKKTALETFDVAPKRITAVPLCATHKDDRLDDEGAQKLLNELGLPDGGYLMYPANFWAHKNHRMLLLAFGDHCKRRPESRLKLVCTGADDDRCKNLREAAADIGLGDRVVFPGYVDAASLGTLFERCRAVIFPSLFEGFGIPVLEAMAWGKPVLCSNVTSLPEVAGDAVLYFDPRRLDQIASAIDRIERDDALVAELTERARQRVTSWPSSDDIAARYLDVFREVAAEPPGLPECVHQVYSDRWTGRDFRVTYQAHPRDRHLEMELTTPDWCPFRRTTVEVTSQGQTTTHDIRRAKFTTIHVPLDRKGGEVLVRVKPVFRPSAYRINEDDRTLGCLCHSIRMVSATSTMELLDGSPLVQWAA